MYHNFFIHSSVDEHLGCFHVLAIVNSAAMNKVMNVSSSTLIYSGYMPRSGIAGFYGGFRPHFLRNLHTISLGHPSAPAPSIRYPASNLDWRSVSCMILYMFQCHSPKSSCPLPLPLSPKVRYTHLCLFCCLAYRVIIAIFLNSIYMC